jgi:hypothetical protein
MQLGVSEPWPTILLRRGRGQEKDTCLLFIAHRTFLVHSTLTDWLANGFRNARYQKSLNAARAWAENRPKLGLASCCINQRADLLFA